MPEGAPRLSGTGLVRVAPHAVAFDPGTKRYYCDIAIDGLEGLYMPFVQLAVATFQRAAHQGQELSGVVLADVVQLMPDRTAILSVAANRAARVTLQGAGPHVPWVRAAHGSVEGWVPDVVGGVATSVVMQIEGRPAAPRYDEAPQYEFAWEPVGKPVAGLTDPPDKPDPATPRELWTHEFPFQSASGQSSAGGPAGLLGRPAGGAAPILQEWRVAIREYEWSSEGPVTSGGTRPRRAWSSPRTSRCRSGRPRSRRRRRA